VLAGNSEKARKAYMELPILAARRRSIFGARRSANIVGHRAPEYDVDGVFAEFEWPFATVPGFVPLESGRWTGVPAPEDDRERLLWVVSEALAPAKPWLPTVAEQDKAWLAVFGERLEQQRRYAANAQAIGARGDFQVGNDIARTL